jgi:hypothetical protein
MHERTKYLSLTMRVRQVDIFLPWASTVRCPKRSLRTVYMHRIYYYYRRRRRTDVSRHCSSRRRRDLEETPVAIRRASAADCFTVSIIVRTIIIIIIPGDIAPRD